MGDENENFPVVDSPAPCAGSFLNDCVQKQMTFNSSKSTTPDEREPRSLQSPLHQSLEHKRLSGNLSSSPPPAKQLTKS